VASPKKYLVLAKVEATQFTDATPTAALNAILAKDLKVTPLKVQSEARNLMRPYFGNSEQIPVVEEAMVEFSVEMAGSGAAGTAPKYAPLLRMCGFAETINAGVSAVYNPISSGFEFGTIYVYRDGTIYKMTGAHGSLSVDMAAKKIPHFKFTLTGKYVAVSDGAIASGADFSGFQQPKASIPAWTGTLTWGAYAAKCAAFSADMASEISHAIWMNNETLAPVDRKPKGSITVEAVTVASNDYFTQVRNATLQAFTLTHGTVAGNKVKLDAPKMQLVDVDETEYEGTLALKFNTTFNPNTGNDEFTITAL